MSRLLSLGVLSQQSSDPAKKLADDYCAYVISQGGVVDYSTVYNIYKEELELNPDFDKLVHFFDFRAGKELVPQETDRYWACFDLINYTKAFDYTLTTRYFTVDSNGSAKRNSINFILRFDTTLNTTAIYRLDFKVLAMNGTNQNIFLQLLDSNNTIVYRNRLGVIETNKKISASQLYDASTGNNVAINSSIVLNNEIVISKNTINWQNRTMFVNVNETLNGYVINANWLPRIATHGQILLLSETDNYFHKLYQL